MVWITGRRRHVQANMITSGYRGAQHNPLSTAESGVVVLISLLILVLCLGFLLCMRVWER